MLEILNFLSQYICFFILHVCGNGSFPKPLTEKQEREYLERSIKGDVEARNKLVEHNLRLVAHIIKKYYGTQSEQDDLVSIGTIGLIKAINTYDLNKDIKLSSYASRCIENEILMHFRSCKKSAQDISLNETIDSDKDGNPLSVQNLLDSRMQRWNGYASFHRPSGLCAIVGMESEGEITHLMALLNDICRESRRILYQPLTIGMGCVVHQIEKIAQSYSGAREAVAYGGIAGDIVYINDVEPRQKPILWLDDKMEADLNYALRFGDEDKILSCVENIVRLMETSGSCNVQPYLISILHVILQVVQKHELDEQLVFGKYADYYGVLSEVDTTERLFQWLSSICYSISACIANARKGTTKTIVQEAKRYIEENYQNSNLSLETLCDHLHMSTAYFSTVFKKEEGESYISYLTGVRMKKAAELLKTTDEKTYVIAAKVGYDEPNYFSYVFKKRYGVSPNKFRGKRG